MICRLRPRSSGEDMSNFNSVLKGEIARVARKEIKNAVDPVRKANANYRREIAELKRQVLALQKEIRHVCIRPSLRTAKPTHVSGRRD